MKPRVQTHLANFEQIRPMLRTGDMFFSCHMPERRKRFFGIPLITTGEVIHAGQLFRRPWHAMMYAVIEGEGFIFESTASFSESGKRGVQRCPVQKRIAQTNGYMWASRLSEDLRSFLDEQALLDWMLSKEGVDYSFAQAGWAGLDSIIKVLPEDLGRKAMMCSRFNMAAIRKGIRTDRPSGFAIAREASPTPAQLSRMLYFFRAHYQIKGDSLKEIG